MIPTILGVSLATRKLRGCWRSLGGVHNFRHSLASALVKMKVDPKTVQEFLRQAHITTTLQLYAQSDMESRRDAQGRYLEQLLGDRVHLLTERIQ
ncbi:MAG: tyrosine-type recombinase/integrase [Terriglobales bacterium]